MSYEPNPNFGYSSVPDLSTLNAPIVTTAPAVSGPSTTATTVGNNTVKIIVIVVLVILIIVSIIFIFVFKNNLDVCRNNENPACPILICPVGIDNVIADPDCGNSAFTFQGTKKICSATRYA